MTGDAEEHVAEACAAHRRSQLVAGRGDGRRHRLDDVVDVVEVRGDDGLAQRPEPGDVQGDVVVHQEDRARAAIARVADVRDDAFDRPSVEVAAAHLDDREEATIVRAATGRLDDVDGPSEQRVPVKHAGRPLRRKNLAGQMTLGPARIAHEPVAASPVQTRDVAAVAAALDRPQQLAEREVALAAHDEIDPERRILVRLGREARVVPADYDPRLGAERSNERDDLVRRLPLKRHHGKADDVGRFRGHKLADSLRHGMLDQHEVGDRDVVVRVHVAGERRQRPVRKPHCKGRRVLERVGHREEQNVHERPPKQLRRTLAIVRPRPRVR